jgi:PTS system fructose-specific IIC component
MRLEDIAAKDLVLLELQSVLRTDAIRELVELISGKRGYSGLVREEYLSEILRRHERAPSGLGHGLAFPNARISNLDKPALAIGLSRRGLNFQARDGRPAHVIFLYLGRSNPPDEEKRMLSCLSRALADPKTADAFMAASTLDEVWKAVLAIDGNQRVGAR